MHAVGRRVDPAALRKHAAHALQTPWVRVPADAVPAHSQPVTFAGDTLVLDGVGHVFHNGVSLAKCDVPSGVAALLAASAAGHNRPFEVYLRDGQQWWRTPDLFVAGETRDILVLQYKWWL